MLEELGVEYELQQIDIRSAERRDPGEFLEASPMGKVPALADGDTKMSESAAICLYLADRYAPGTLAPLADDPRRGKFLYWLMYTPAVIEPAMSEKFNQVEPAPQRSGWGDFDLMIKTLENGLRDKTWILGDDFSAADVMLGSSAVFLRAFNMLPQSATLEAYAERCLDRPAYRKATEIQDKP
jgi:glutathione S-transferase